MKLKLLTAALAALVLSALPAMAQVPQAYQNTVANRVVNIPVTPTNPLPVTATVSSAAVQGTTASGATATDNPLLNGCRAATATPTSVTNGQKVAAQCTVGGKQVVQPYAIPENLVQGLTAAMTGTTSTAVTGMGAPAAGLRNYITTIVCGNSHATVGTFVELQDGSGGTTFWTGPAAPAYGGFALTFPAPLRQPTTATALYVKDTTTGANVICSASGFTAP